MFPSPTVLAEYKAVDPEFVKRMLTAAEREQRHRHWRDGAPEWTARLGVICGLLIGLAGLGAAGYIAYIGSAIPGALLGAADLLGLVGVFIYGSRQQAVPRALPTSEEVRTHQLRGAKANEAMLLPSTEDKAGQQRRA
jgi:uncharacterized membrane protein